MSKLIQLKNGTELYFPITQETILFSSTGTIGAFQLSDSITNYKRIKVYYRSAGTATIQSSVEFDPRISGACSILLDTDTGSGFIFISSLRLTFSAKNVNVNKFAYVGFSASGFYSYTGGLDKQGDYYGISIVKVIGYK